MGANLNEGGQGGIKSRSAHFRGDDRDRSAAPGDSRTRGELPVYLKYFINITPLQETRPTPLTCP